MSVLQRIDGTSTDTWLLMKEALGERKCAHENYQ